MMLAPGFNLALSAQAIEPQDVTMHAYDIGAYYETERFHIEGEYLYKTYEDNAFKDVSSVKRLCQLRPAAEESVQEDVVPRALRHDDPTTATHRLWTRPPAHWPSPTTSATA